MKTPILLLSLFIIYIASCKKESKDLPGATNHPPVANAGPDLAVTIESCHDRRTIELNGNASYDPDDESLNFEWTKISGPSGVMSNNLSAKSIFSFLTNGQFIFELKVTDRGGLSSKDTISLIVNGSILPTEFNLDLNLSGKYYFEDNWVDCDDNYISVTCYSYDYTIFSTSFILPPYNIVEFSAFEAADTAVNSFSHNTEMIFSIVNGGYARGHSSIIFKRLIEAGGGTFEGTCEIEKGSAAACIGLDFFDGLDPLTITGSLEASNKIINLAIKGKMYF